MSLEDDIIKLKLPPPNYKKTPITLYSLMTLGQQIDLDFYSMQKALEAQRIKREKEDAYKGLHE